ncbi:MAG: MiaB/RimO family radical SAM methylthiotransferase, partial [Pseudomonadota bacterium]
AAVLVNDIMAVRESAPHLIDGYGDRARAFLQVQNGCDHRCTFCIIPYGRGNARSVPVDRVVEQARRLVDAGHKELVLTGVDITSYGPDLEGKPTLGALVSTLLDQVPDLFRLRLSSIDGAEIDDALFERITGDNRVAPYLHLSVQSGDDMILKRMKRRHTRAQAIDICARVRAARPDIAFGADIIAGFPTETEAMFENSVHLIEQAGLNFVHVFPYSARAGTPAARMPQVDGAVIKDRAARLRAAATSAKHRFLESLEGSDQVTIVESGNRARLGCFATVKLPEAAPNMPALTPGMLARLIVGPRDRDLVTTKTVPQVQENA